MTDASVNVQIVPDSLPSLPPWFGEVAVLAQVLTQGGVLKAIEHRVRFARARFGHYDTIDFVVVLIGYAVSGEPTLQAFYERLLPFAPAFMALFGRHELPCRSTLSRFLAALDQASVEALRLLFQQDLVARPTFASPPGGLWDRQGKSWLVVDVDGTRQAARQRALPHTPDLPAPHRRFEQVCAPGYLGRRRGEVLRTRTTLLQAHTHQWLGTYSGPGNGDYRKDLLCAVEGITGSASALSLPRERIILRLDGLYGNTAPLLDVLAAGLGAIGRCKQYSLLDLPQVQARLAQPPDAETTHPESGTRRALFDCPAVPLGPAGVVVRLIVATHPASASAAPIGVTREGLVTELFWTVLPQDAFTPADVVDLSLHRGSFETVLADEDSEQDPDRWCSRTPCGQEFWQILSQWVWNLRLELGHHLSPEPMRMTEFAPAHVGESPQSVAAAHVAEPVSYGPPQWARRAFTKGFAGSDFRLFPDGTLRCPADRPFYAQERRPERDGSVRVLYAARIGHCRPCPLRAYCQESTTTRKPRRVSAVFWPIDSSQRTDPPVQSETRSAQGEPLCAPALCPVLWGDWERCRIRRRWFGLLRTQTVTVVAAQAAEKMDTPKQLVQTRAQRAHWRLSWEQRLARNARLSTAPPLEITIHGLPATFAQSFGFGVVTAASCRIKSPMREERRLWHL